MRIKTTLKLLFLILGLPILIFVIWLFVGKAPQAQNINWGISFSQKQSDLLGLSWKDNYLAILDDLKVSHLKVTAYWDLIEKEPGNYFFDDLDFQVKEAQKRNVKLTLAIGRKVPRWPECHVPEWAKGLGEEKQQESVLKLIEKIVLRYKDSENIWAWQVENEPFFPFGDCPETDEDFLKKEISLVKKLNPEKLIMISDSGSNRFWIKTSTLGDVVGISLYRKVWFHNLNSYVEYPFPPVFYWRKYQIVKAIFNKRVICGELQAEPWGKTLLSDLPKEEQEKTMSFEQFKSNIEFAKKTGFDEFYLWGAEWWYWLKTKQNDSRIWDEARELFKESN